MCLTTLCMSLWPFPCVYLKRHMNTPWCLSQLECACLSLSRIVMIPQCIAIRASVSRYLQSSSVKSKWSIRRWSWRTHRTKTSVCTRRFFHRFETSCFSRESLSTLHWGDYPLLPDSCFDALGRIGRCRVVESSFFRNRKLCGRSVLRMEVLRDRYVLCFRALGFKKSVWKVGTDRNARTFLLNWCRDFYPLVFWELSWALSGCCLERSWNDVVEGRVEREREMRGAFCVLHNILPLTQNHHINPKHGHGRCALCMCVSCRCGM